MKIFTMKQHGFRGHNMRDFIELLKAFGLFVSCLVIGYGGLFLFFY